MTVALSYTSVSGSVITRASFFFLETAVATRGPWGSAHFLPSLLAQRRLASAFTKAPSCPPPAPHSPLLVLPVLQKAPLKLALIPRVYLRPPVLMVESPPGPKQLGPDIPFRSGCFICAEVSKVKQEGEDAAVPDGPSGGHLGARRGGGAGRAR